MNKKEEEKVEKERSRQLNVVRKGCVSVETWINPDDKVFYLLRIGYRDDARWVNQKVSVLESEIPVVMCLLRESLCYPKKVYAHIYEK
jgi:hypothetical protein